LTVTKDDVELIQHQKSSFMLCVRLREVSLSRDIRRWRLLQQQQQQQQPTRDIRRWRLLQQQLLLRGARPTNNWYVHSRQETHQQQQHLL
jgi:hypothetical protein